MIGYQYYRLCQSFGTLTKFMTKFMMQKRFLDFSDSLFYLYSLSCFCFNVLTDCTSILTAKSFDLSLTILLLIFFSFCELLTYPILALPIVWHLKPDTWHLLLVTCYLLPAPHPWWVFLSRSFTTFTGLKVMIGTSTNRVIQCAIEPFHKPGSSNAFSGRPI